MQADMDTEYKKEFLKVLSKVKQNVRATRFKDALRSTKLRI